MRIKVGTFNLLNLVEPGVPYYNKKPYSGREFEEKTAWISAQLSRMDAHFVGFQEVFHESALKKVVNASGLFENGTVAAPLADGKQARVGFATSLPLVEGPELYTDFPDDLAFSIDDVPMPVQAFSRPVLKVVVQLNSDHIAAIFVAHLKSKRPIIVDEDKEHDPKERALGKARSLIVRAAEAAAFRSLLVDEMQHNQRPVIVLGDLNDAVHAVTTDIVAGSPPWRFLPRKQKEVIWDVLLYSTYDIQARNSPRDVSFSHIYNGNYDTLDHIFVSEEFFKYNPDRIGNVEYLRFFNDHIVDDTLSSERSSRIESDHGQLVATIRLRSGTAIPTSNPLDKKGNPKMQLIEFETIEELDKHLQQGKPLSNAVFQSLDLRQYTEPLRKDSVSGSLFLGCRIAPEALEHLLNSGALVFPKIEGVPFDAYRNSLYSPDELVGDYEPGNPDSYNKTLDGRIYNHYIATGKANPSSILETISRRLHDHAISDALGEMLIDRRVVGIMGGHSMKRDHPDYIKVAQISRELTRRGYLTVSGGGPGAMEATHLGAWFTHLSDKALEDAVEILGRAPHYKPMDRWLDTTFEVRSKYPLASKNGKFPQSLGVPTWLYGHEPPTAFATHIAKYFANSVREEGLLAIAKNGVIFAPGSAGTIQEIFQDATQNHYNSLGVISPMIFFGESYWKWRKPVFPLLAELAAGREYASLIKIADSVDEIVELIEEYRG